MITNRTQQDVNSIDLNSTVPSRGAYNYTDLNRVESKVAELNAWLISTGYMTEVLSTKTDWHMGNTMGKAQGNSYLRYLNNVKKIRQAMAVAPNTPSVPTTMNKLTYTMANNIEKILVDKEVQLNSMENYYVYCGVSRFAQPRVYQNRFRHFTTYIQPIWDDFAYNFKWSNYADGYTWGQY